MTTGTLTVGLTGPDGFVGRHTALALQNADCTVVRLDRTALSDPARLARLVARCDTVVHLAGANRGDAAEVAATNVDLAWTLVRAFESARVAPRVVYTSSTQEEPAADGTITSYGASKREAGDVLMDWARRKETVATSLTVPNVFGPGCRPFYNSVTATFCHLLARGEQPQVQVDKDLELIFVGDLAAEIADYVVAHPEETGRVRVYGELHASVSELLEELTTMSRGYFAAGEVPDLSNEARRQLFATFLSHIPAEAQRHDRVKHADARGDFVEVLKLREAGQVSFSTTRPGVTRGEHYHTRKFEWFCVVRGQAVIRIRAVGGTEVIEHTVDGSEPRFITIPPMHTHNITNVGSEELLTLFWISEQYDAEDADTFYEPVEAVEMPQRLAA